MVTAWTLEKIQSYRDWHEQKINEMYANAPKLQHELRQARERWLVMVLPRKGTT